VAEQLDPEQGGARVASAQVPGVEGLLKLAVGVVVIAALFFARDVLIPITLAILLSFVLSPVVAFFRRLRLPRPPAVLLAVLMALGLLGGAGTLVGVQVASLAGDAPAYARTIQAKVDRAQAFAAERLSAFAGEEAPPPRTSAEPGALERAAAGVSAPRRAVPVVVQDQGDTPLETARTVLEPVLAPFETFVIVLVVAIFILMQKEDLRDRMIRVFGSSDLHRTTTAMDEAGARLSRYFLSQLAVNASFGTIIALGLWFIGVPVPVLWGILAGMLRFVPYIGALLGAALPLAIAAGVEPGWSMVIQVAILFAAVEPLIGYAVEPMLYGHSTGLSPLSVVVAAVFWTWIWGPVGLVLSMPLTLCLVVLGRHVPALEFLDVMLGDRPALSPVESFYQRMLADDPEEALEQADVLLRTQSLTGYYDEVALGGLKLAAADARRGAVDRRRAERIVRSMLDVVHELDDRDGAPPPADADPRGPLHPVAPDGSGEVAAPEPDHAARAPAAWAAPGSVLCVAGRGVLDDAVTAMLEQLLQHRGFGVRRVPHAAAGRDAIERLDANGVRLICLSYLELGGTPSHLRYLVRRLRAAAPGAAVIVGLWPQAEAAMTDVEVQRLLGADAYVGTLAGAVDQALTIAARPDAAAAAAA